MNLTTKEQLLLNAVEVGMDSPGSGWFDQLMPTNDYHVWVGVLSSLIKKGILRSDKDGNAYWIELR